MDRYNDDLVSVIIPTYNRAQKCKGAVESVLSQSHDNVEVIVVDDGSCDNTRDIIKSSNDNVVYIYQDNAGVSAARNTGLRRARGEYIAFLDSDDRWLPWKLEAELSILHAFPDAGMVWTDMAAVDENGAIVQESYLKTMYAAYAYFNAEKHFRLNTKISDIWSNCPSAFVNRQCFVGNIFSWMFMGNLVHTSTVLLRKMYQEKVGLFDVSLLKSGEDYDYHFRTCRIGDVAFIDIPSINYCIGASDQLTNNAYLGYIALNNLKTILKMLAVAKDEISLPRSMIRKRISQSYGWLGMTEFNQNRFKASIHLFKSLLLYPRNKRVMAYFILSFCPHFMTDLIKDGMSLFETFLF